MSMLKVNVSRGQVRAPSHEGPSRRAAQRAVVATVTGFAFLFAAISSASAYQESFHARSGDVSATLRWVVPERAGASRASIRIDRGGEVSAGDLELRNCGAAVCNPVDGGPYRALRVVDLDADDQSEIVVSYATLGAHCCVLAKVLDFRGERYRSATFDFGDAGFRLRRYLSRSGWYFRLG